MAEQSDSMTPIERVIAEITAYQQIKDQLHIEQLVLSAWPPDSAHRDYQVARIDAFQKLVDYFEKKII